MDYKAYQESYFAHPAPEARFAFRGILGATLFFSDYEAAAAFYQRVLGPPAYVEGKWTRGWRLGGTWLTLLKGGSGIPGNVEVPIVMESPAEAECLQAGFIEAGGVGESPSDQLMYQPIRYCPVTDPFGTSWLIYALLEQDQA